MTIIINDNEVEEVDEPAEFLCAGCHSTIAGEPSATLNVGTVCEDCHGTCMDCSTDFNMNSGSPHASTDDGYACGRCTRNNWMYCAHCSDWASNDSGAYVQYLGSVCEYCRDNAFTWCEGCDEYREQDDYDHFDNCNTSGLVHDYSYRPTPGFHHTLIEYDNARIIEQESQDTLRKYRKIAYMGFELEVECESDRNSYRNGAESFGSISEVYLKGDGSLNYGFEIVTHPMTLDYAMGGLAQPLWDTIEALGSKGFSAWETSTAGLHVHVSRDGFACESHQARFVHFVHRNEEFLSWLAGRGKSRWASYSKEQLQNLRGKLRRQYNSERYMAVNLNNSGTLEVRIFRASTEPLRIKMALQLVDAIVNYTEKLSANQMVLGKAFSSESFIQWVSPQARYAILTDYLTRWVEPFQSGLPQIGE